MKSTTAIGAGVLVLAAIFGHVAAGCGDEGAATTTGPCPQGICGSGSGAGSGSSGPGSGGGGGGAPTCAWLCTPWDTGSLGSNDATRTCVDEDGCADPSVKPPETATLPALDYNFYECQVEPVLDRLCAQLMCHGVEPDLARGEAGRALRTYHRGRLRVSDTNEILTSNCGSGSQPAANCTGSIECACWQSPHTPTEWQRNFDAARGLALDMQTGTELADKAESEMLTQPERGNGLPHAGIKIWNTSDAEYQTILQWLQGQTQASCNSQN